MSADLSVALLVEHAAELVTVAGPSGPRTGPAQSELAVVQDGAVAVGTDGRILAVGPTAEIRRSVEIGAQTEIVDATGRSVLPGFVDPHTHAIFAGDRAGEFEQRLAGADYLRILAAGGGILSTVRATREAPIHDLVDRAAGFLDQMLLHGTTTLEIKSGYGLSTEAEVKMLRVVQALRERVPQTLVPTLLAAHAVPDEFRGDADGYVTSICEEIIPAVAAEHLAEFCDVFCERGVFTVEQSREILRTAQRYGLAPKLHAEQKSAFGGTALGCELGAASVDHLEYATEEDIQRLARSGVVGVLLPGAAFTLRETHRAPARALIEAGVPVALSTDFNPGTCYILSPSVVVGIACLQIGLSPAEAIVAATINAAHAIGKGAEVGSLEPGKRGDLIVLDAPSYRHIPYRFGANLVRTVVKDGRMVVKEGSLVSP